MTNLIPRIFTRRALVSLIQSRQDDHRQPHVQPPGARPHSSFPLTLTVGLMTIGVILIVSLLQLVTSYFS